MTQPTVSIVIPVFNRESVISRAVDSVLNQSFTNWELLLIDDGSTDKSFQRILDYSAKDNRIVPLRNDNTKGASGARNTGVDAAKGKYIAYLDSDDEWEPYHLKTSVYYLEAYPDEIDIVTANPLRLRSPNGEVYKRDLAKLNYAVYRKIEEAFIFDNTAVFNFQLCHRALTTQCIVGKADLIRKVRWNESLHAATDILYNLELCYMKPSICHLQNFHVKYWAQEDSLTNNTGVQNAQNMEKSLRAFVLHWQIVLGKFELTNEQKRYVHDKLKGALSWHLAYGCLEKQGKYNEAMKAYVTALKYSPLDAKVYSALLKSILKLLLNKFF